VQKIVIENYYSLVEVTCCVIDNDVTDRMCCLEDENNGRR